MVTLARITADNRFDVVCRLEDEMAKTDDDREISLRIEDLELDEYMASALLWFFQDCSQKGGLEMDRLVIFDGTFNLCLVSVINTAICPWICSRNYGYAP
jgi:hypothetical protein